MEGCPGVSETRAAMRVHFVHWHVHNTVVILEEGNIPLPRCPRCDLQVSRKALNGRHLDQSVKEGDGAEAKEASGGRVVGRIGEDVPCLWDKDAGGDGVQVPR